MFWLCRPCCCPPMPVMKMGMSMIHQNCQLVAKHRMIAAGQARPDATPRPC